MRTRRRRRRIDHAFLTDEDHHDLEALVDGVELARAFAASEPFASMLDRELEPGPAAPARHDLRDAVRAGVIHYWHPVGTCAMGSVTDADGRVQGVDGLVVADASVMPVTPRATTNIPTVVVAERIARALSFLTKRAHRRDDDRPRSSAEALGLARRWATNPPPSSPHRTTKTGPEHLTDKLAHVLGRTSRSPSG